MCQLMELGLQTDLFKFKVYVSKLCARVTPIIGVQVPETKLILNKYQ